MWTCTQCKTANPDASTFCQTCGEKHSSVGNKPTKPNSFKTPNTSSQTVHSTLTFEQEATRKYPKGDYSAINLYGTIATVFGCFLILACFISAIVVFLSDEMTFISFILAAFIFLPAAFMCFLIASLTDLVLQAKNEVNEMTRTNHIQMKLMEQLLDTVKSSQTSSQHH